MTGTFDTFKMFSFSVMRSTFRFSNVQIGLPGFLHWKNQTEKLNVLKVSQVPVVHLVVTRIINGHFWRCMSKHTKRQVKVK